MGDAFASTQRQLASLADEALSEFEAGETLRLDIGCDLQDD